MSRSATKDADTREARREEILNAALTVYIRGGYHGADMGDVAHEAGLAKGLVYYYYKSKQELFRALFAWAAEGGAAMYARLATESGDTPPLERLLRFALGVYRQAIEDPRLVQFSMRLPFDAAAVLGKEEWMAGRDLSASHMRLIAGLLRACIQCGAIPPQDVELSANSFWTVFVASLFQFTRMIGNEPPQGALPDAQGLDPFWEIARFAFRGLGARDEDWEPIVKSFAYV